MENFKGTKLDWAMCIDCGWHGKSSDCVKEDEYSEWHGMSFKYSVCPKCSGAIELTSSMKGDLL